MKTVTFSCAHPLESWKQQQKNAIEYFLRMKVMRQKTYSSSTQKTEKSSALRTWTSFSDKDAILQNFNMQRSTENVYLCMFRCDDDIRAGKLYINK